MNSFPKNLVEKLRQKSTIRLVAGLFGLGLIVAVGTYVRGNALGLAPASTVQASAVVQQSLAATPTPIPPMPGMPGMTGMNASPTANAVMPGMSMPTAEPYNPVVTNPSMPNSDMDALVGQMQSMMQSLQGMMGQLDQKGMTAYVAPSPTPAVTYDTQAWAAELAQINRTLGPLMLRIQSDLQGNPTVEELNAVRSQVEQLNTRIANLMVQIQAARNGTAPVAQATADATMGGMTGMNGMSATNGSFDQSQAMLNKVDELMKHMQEMMTQIQNQQMQSGGAVPGQMSGMPGMATPDPMAGMGNMPGMTNQAQATPMPGMSGSGASMDDMMGMMDNMMSMMDGMMSMMNTNMGSSGTPTAMPGMSSSSSSMGDMMMMMDNMMMMMDDMMGMMDDMMMGGSGSMGGSGGMMGMPDM